MITSATYPTEVKHFHMKAIAAIAVIIGLAAVGSAVPCSCARNETQHSFHHGRRHRLDAAEHLSPRISAR